MNDIRLPIDDATIISLFRAGYSQNDIVSRYDVTFLRTRAVLQGAGEDTRGFRTLSDTAQRVIELLVKAGVYYRDIETVCDVSFHAVRDFVERRDLQGKRGHRRVTFTVPKDMVFEDKFEFLQGYLSGISFFSMVSLLSLDDTGIVLAHRAVSAEHIVKHRANLRIRIEQEHTKGLSPAGIARKLDISRSIVRELLSCR